MSFLEAHGIVKRYAVGGNGLTGNGLTVLRDLDLTVEAGEMLAIMGASGVGKSTLLHIRVSVSPSAPGIQRRGERRDADAHCADSCG